MGSLAGYLGHADMSIYSAAKAFSRVFVEGLWLEMREHGVDVVEVILGVTRTVALDLVPKAQVGSWVLVHAGYGIEVVSEQYAQETLDLIRQFPDLVAEDAPGMGQAQG